METTAKVILELSERKKFCDNFRISGRSFGPNFGFPYTFYTFSLLPWFKIGRSASLGRLFLPNRPLGWPLQQKRLTTAFYKASNNLFPFTIPEYVKPSSGCTRTHDLAYVQLWANYEQYKNSFLLRTFREWNSLPPDLVHAASVDEFTACLQNYTF